MVQTISNLHKSQKRNTGKRLNTSANSHSDKLLLPQGDMWIPLGATLTGLKNGKIKPCQDAGKFKGKKLRY